MTPLCAVAVPALAANDVLAALEAGGEREAMANDAETPKQSERSSKPAPP